MDKTTTVRELAVASHKHVSSNSMSENFNAQYISDDLFCFLCLVMRK